LFEKISKRLANCDITMCIVNNVKKIYTPKSVGEVYDKILMPLYMGEIDCDDLKKQLSPECNLQHEGNNLENCGEVFISNSEKRKIGPWVPRNNGSSAGITNTMEHLKHVLLHDSKRIFTNNDILTLTAIIPNGRKGGSIEGGSMEGGIPLDLKFSNTCSSGNEKNDIFNLVQSPRYLELFKSVIRRLNTQNEVDQDVIDRLKVNLTTFQAAECKLIQDAYKLTNTLKRQNNGDLNENENITCNIFDDFKKSSNNTVKSQSNLLDVLVKLLDTHNKPA